MQRTLICVYCKYWQKWKVVDHDTFYTATCVRCGKGWIIPKPVEPTK